MNAAERYVEFPHHVAERYLERRLPSDQHIVMAGAKRGLGVEPHHFAQPAAYPVPLHGIAHLLGNREADPHEVTALAGFGAMQRLHDESAARRPRAPGGGLKVRPAFQPLHETDFKPH
jgi:hypothetical protein